jgi:hypothetical protein
MSQHETLRELRRNIAAAMARLGDDWRNERDDNGRRGR